MNNTEKLDIKKLEPFKLFVLQNFPFIEVDFDALTNYEIMAKMTEYMNNINNNTITLAQNDTNVFSAFNTVVDYINNYFNNLDVQDEINIKLNSMATSGELTQLISDYVNPYIEEQNSRISEINEKVNTIASGSPLVASSINDMSDTTRIYVNTSDGNWYYYNGTNWIAGGTYQSAVNDRYLNNDSLNSVQNRTIKEYTNYLENNSQSKSVLYNLSNLALKYNKMLPLKFNNGTFVDGNFNYRDNTSRGITEFFTYVGKLYIYNFNSVKYDILEYDSENTLIRRKGASYPITPYYEWECKEGYKYLFMTYSGNDNVNLSLEQRQNVEKNLYVFMEPLEEKDLSLIVKNSNLFTNIIDGYYVDRRNGNLQENANMCCTDYINVKERTKLYLNNVYVQIAFYNYNKQYISGFYIHPVNQPPTTVYQVLDVPSGAFYMKVSTRLSYKDIFVISEDTIPTYYNNTNILPYTIPKHLIKESDINYIYNLDLKKHLYPDEVTKTGTNDVTDGIKINTNGYIKYNKYITVDKSITQFLFKCEENSIFAIGNDISIYNTMNDAGLKIEINTTNKTIKVYSSNWETYTSLKKETTFDFDISNGNLYCLKITKDTIYNIKIELFNANTPNEVTTVNIYTDKEDTSVIGTNIARVWGCGRVDVTTGSIILVNMSMYVNSKKYPKLFIIGDSYVENYSRPYNYSYARILYDILDGDVAISGAGGNTSSAILRRLINELPYIHPRYIIVNTGVNDRNITSDLYIQNMNNIINNILSLNITPILVTCPRVMDTDNIETMTTINNFVRTSGYKYIDLAYALSTGDGITQDSSKFNTDKIHPNNKGADAIINWISANFPELLIKD